MIGNQYNWAALFSSTGLRRELMSNRLKLTLMALSVGIGLSSTYFFLAARNQRQRQDAAMTLIRDLDSLDQKLSQASFEMGLSLTQFLESGDGADLGAVQQAHRTLAESVAQCIAVVSQLQAPESEHGSPFISAHRRFLLVQRHIIRDDFGKLLKQLEDESTALSKRRSSIQAIVNSAYAETEQEFAKVHEVRDKFAEEFDIRLTPQR